MRDLQLLLLLFFFNDTATTEIYTLSLHDALPISCSCAPRIRRRPGPAGARWRCWGCLPSGSACRAPSGRRSEEHTSELQSQSNLVCRLLLEKKKKRGLTTAHDSGIHCSHNYALDP